MTGIVLAVMLVVRIAAVEMPIGLGQERVLELTHTLHAADGEGRDPAEAERVEGRRLLFQQDKGTEKPLAHVEPMSR